MDQFEKDFDEQIRDLKTPIAKCFWVWLPVLLALYTIVTMADFFKLTKDFDIRNIWVFGGTIGLSVVSVIIYVIIHKLKAYRSIKATAMRLFGKYKEVATKHSQLVSQYTRLSKENDDLKTQMVYLESYRRRLEYIGNHYLTFLTQVVSRKNSAESVKKLLEGMEEPYGR